MLSSRVLIRRFLIFMRRATTRIWVCKVSWRRVVGSWSWMVGCRVKMRWECWSGWISGWLRRSCMCPWEPNSKTVTNRFQRITSRTPNKVTPFTSNSWKKSWESGSFQATMTQMFQSPAPWPGSKDWEKRPPYRLKIHGENGGSRGFMSMRIKLEVWPGGSEGWSLCLSRPPGIWRIKTRDRLHGWWLIRSWRVMNYRKSRSDFVTWIMLFFIS